MVGAYLMIHIPVMYRLWTRVVLGAYRLIGSSIYPFMGAFLAIRAREGKEDRKHRYERYGYPSACKPAGPVVWFHAASVGESIALIALIERVRSFGISVIMTTGTVTSAKVVRERLGEKIYHQYAPMDVKRAVKRFLDHWKPDFAVFAESEIWPISMMELATCKIPLLLVNARMSDKSFLHWNKVPRLSEELYDKFACVIAQSELDAERFRNLGARLVYVSGNLKVDTSPLPVKYDQLQNLQKQIGKRPVWVAASTHPPESKIVMDAHRYAAKRIKGLLTIIVPRHPNRIENIFRQLHVEGIRAAQRSKNQIITENIDMYVGDSVGEMGLYLRLSEVTFVGKSLGAYGGQNPLEPAMLNTAILSGNHVHNFRHIYQSFQDAGAVRLIHDQNMLGANVVFLLQNKQERDKMIAAAHKVLAEMQGALDHTFKFLDPYVYPLMIKQNLESFCLIWGSLPYFGGKNLA